jgi:hypothetical protein
MASRALNGPMIRRVLTGYRAEEQALRAMNRRGPPPCLSPAAP